MKYECLREIIKKKLSCIVITIHPQLLKGVNKSVTPRELYHSDEVHDRYKVYFHIQCLILLLRVNIIILLLYYLRLYPIILFCAYINCNDELKETDNIVNPLAYLITSLIT